MDGVCDLSDTASGPGSKTRLASRSCIRGLLSVTALCALTGAIADGQTAPTASTLAPSRTDKTRMKTGGTGTVASTMQLKREVTGNLDYRFITGQDSSAPPTALPAATGSDGLVAIAIPSEIEGKDAQLEVIDGGRGKVAHLAVTTGKAVPLTANDFTLIQTVLVPVEVKGRGALVNATVTLADGARRYRKSWLLKPTDNGTAQFNDVPLGVPVTATVSSGSDAPLSQTQTLPSDLSPEGYRWQTIQVDWPDASAVAPVLPASTAPAPSAVAPVTTAAPVRPVSSDPLGGIISTLISLVVLGGIAYGLLWAYRNGHLKKFLDGLGIQVQPVAADGPQGSPFASPERRPVQPIVEGTADPLDGVGFASSAAPVPAASAGPRLVATLGAYSGNIFPLGPGATDVGRDAMNPVALPQDTNASRRHAIILAQNGQYTVTDNGSSNGTFVNGVRIAAQTPQPLRPGDELQIGMTRFRFEA